MFGFPYCFSNFEHVNEMGFLFPIWQFSVTKKGNKMGCSDLNYRILCWHGLDDS
jgi:hypothetical protein